MSREPLRKIDLRQRDAEELRAALHCEDAELIGDILAIALIKLKERKNAAWEDVMRLAAMDREKEDLRICWVSNQILVYPKGLVDEEESA